MSILQNVSDLLELAIGEISPIPEINIKSVIDIWDVPVYWIPMIEDRSRHEQPPLTHLDYDRIIPLRVKSFDELYRNLWVMTLAVKKGVAIPDVNYTFDPTADAEDISLIGLFANSSSTHQKVQDQLRRIAVTLSDLYQAIDGMSEENRDVILPSIKIRYGGVLLDTLCITEMLLDRK